MGTWKRKPYLRGIIGLAAVIILGLTTILAVDAIQGRRSILEAIQSEAWAASPVTGNSRPARADEQFYAALERLLNRKGPDPHQWSPGPDKRIVADYLKNVHGLNLEDAVFARNLLGLGIGNTPDMAREMRRRHEQDAWGIPYDLILASSRGESSQMDMLQGFFINQGLGMFNPELSQYNYVVLKADFHSQFGDVFRNFNGISIRIIAREVNFIGSPGSADEDYISQIRPALTAADSLHASIYIGDNDQVPQIIPKRFADMAENMGFNLPMPSSPRRPMGPMKPVPVDQFQLPGCSHDLEDYKAGMRARGTTMLNYRRI